MEAISQTIDFCFKLGEKVQSPPFLVTVCQTGETLCKIAMRAMPKNTPIYVDPLYNSFRALTDYTWAVSILSSLKYFKDKFLKDCHKVKEGNYQVIPKIFACFVGTFSVDIPTTIQYLQQYHVIREDTGFHSTLSARIGEIPSFGVTSSNVGDKLTLISLIVLCSCFAFEGWRRLQINKEKIIKTEEEIQKAPELEKQRLIEKEEIKKNAVKEIKLIREEVTNTEEIEAKIENLTERVTKEIEEVNKKYTECLERKVKLELTLSKLKEKEWKAPFRIGSTLISAVVFSLYLSESLGNSNHVLVAKVAKHILDIYTGVRN